MRVCVCVPVKTILSIYLARESERIVNMGDGIGGIVNVRNIILA